MLFRSRVCHSPHKPSSPYSTADEPGWKHLPVPASKLRATRASIPKFLASPSNATSKAVAKPVIAYGSLASPGQFPSLASLQYYPGVSYHVCGATLIAKNLLLTAAHCVFSAYGQDLPSTALLGGISLTSLADFQEVFPLVDVWISDRYDHSVWATGRVPYGDLAVIRFEGLSNMKPATLSVTTPLHGQFVTAPGWGADENYASTAIYPTSLYYTNLIMSTGVAPCNFSATGIICSTAVPFGRSQYTSVCQGDSGGPQFLAGTNVQIGISSFVEQGPDGCGRNSYNGMTSVAAYRSGIVSIIEKYGIQGRRMGSFSI